LAFTVFSRIHFEDSRWESGESRRPQSERVAVFLDIKEMK